MSLIVLEGLDGSGKSTQHEMLLARLRAEGAPARGISFPDYDEPSSSLVKMYLNGEFGADPGDVNAYAVSSFYAVDRFASFKKFWRRDFEKNLCIIAARYTTSNAIYQMAKLPFSQWQTYLDWLYDFEFNRMSLPAPDAVIFLDMPCHISQKLMTARYNGDESKKDLHEKSVQYLDKCRDAAFFAASRGGWRVVDCARGDLPLPPEEINDALYNHVKEFLHILG